MAVQPRERLDRQQPRPDPELRRTGRKLSVPGLWFTAIGTLPMVVGILLVVLSSGWPWALGIVLIVLSLPIYFVGISLLLGAGVAKWASWRWPFA
jgi:Flp pilus assembly protein TadB